MVTITVVNKKGHRDTLQDTNGQDYNDSHKWSGPYRQTRIGSHLEAPRLIVRVLGDVKSKTSDVNLNLVSTNDQDHTDQ